MMPYLASAAGSSTVYNISGDRAVVTTEVKNAASSYDKLMMGYLTDRFISALKDMSGVTSVQLTKGEETLSAESSYLSYRTKTRKSNLFLTMNLPTKVSFLLALEESYNVCTKGATEIVVGGEDGGYSSSSCSLESKIKISGPLSVYGSFAQNSLVGFNEDGLKDLQDASFTLSKSYNGKDVSLRTTFNVNSMMFDRALAGFLKTFNVQGVDMTVVGMSRQNVLLGSSRVLRMVNEKMIEDKAGGK